MKNAAGVIVLLTLTACVAPPPQIRSAPAPTAQEIEQIRSVQTRVVSTPVQSAFPKAIETLMDNGFIVRSADAASGLICFYQQWNDTSQNGADITEEGSALLTQAGAGSTRIRVVLTGGWQTLAVGPHSAAMVGAVQQGASTDEYSKLLDMFQSGLTGP